MTSNDPSLVFRKIYTLTLQQQLLKVQKFEKDLIICPVSTTLFFQFQVFISVFDLRMFREGKFASTPILFFNFRHKIIFEKLDLNQKLKFWLDMQIDSRSSNDGQTGRFLIVRDVFGSDFVSVARVSNL